MFSDGEPELHYIQQDVALYIVSELKNDLKSYFNFLNMM